MIGRSYTIKSRWASRAETPLGCAESLARMLTDLASADPIFRWWLWRNASLETLTPRRRMPPDIDDLITILNWANPACAAADAVLPAEGYRLSAWNCTHDISASIHIAIGRIDGTRHFPNVVDLHLPFLSPTTAQYHRVDRIIHFMTILAAAWRPDWMYVEPSWLSAGLFMFPREMRPVRAGWITYLKPDFAAAIVPPPALETRTTPEGGLLLITGTEPLDPENAAEIAALTEVQKALAPLQAG